MQYNTRTGRVAVDLRTGLVTLDGEQIGGPPATSAPLARLYLL
jgi:hypothetical protein